MIDIRYDLIEVAFAWRPLAQKGPGGGHQQGRSNPMVRYIADHNFNFSLTVLAGRQIIKVVAAGFLTVQALAGDIDYPETYYYYADLLIQTGEYSRAKKLIKYGYKIKGINLSRMKHNEGLIAEIKGNLQKAKKYMKFAYNISYRKFEREFLKEELDRINLKLKSKKKSSNK